MDKRKRSRLEKSGWKVGTVGEFLNLSPKEVTIVEVRLALSLGRQGIETAQEGVSGRASSNDGLQPIESGKSGVKGTLPFPWTSWSDR